MARRLAWICWRHPQMPWDGTELWVADVDAAGGVTNARRVAGSETESIYQPGWTPGGELWFVSDRDDRWRLYRQVRGAGSSDPAMILPVQPAPPADAETGRPQWILGTSCWAFTSATRVVVSFTREGRWHLGCRRSRYRRVPRARARARAGPVAGGGRWRGRARGGQRHGAGCGHGGARRVGRHARAARGAGPVDRRGLPVGAAVALVSHRWRPHRAAVLLSTAQPRLRAPSAANGRRSSSSAMAVRWPPPTRPSTTRCSSGPAAGSRWPT